MTALERLVAFLEARDDAEPGVGEAMRSQVRAGTGDDVIVLVHGLTASPPAWHAIAERAHADGATVVALRLPFHGHSDRLTDVLRGISAEHLVADLEAVLGAVRALGGRMTIAGHSLGGTLALYAAANVAGIDRAVAIAPFLGIAALPRRTHAAVLPLMRAFGGVFLWWDPVQRATQMPAHGYPRYPLRALDAGLTVADGVWRDALRPPQSRAIDIVLNANESSVNNRIAERLAQRWRAARANVAVHRLEGLVPSHDIIEIERPMARRVHETLVTIIAGRTPLGADRVYRV